VHDVARADRSERAVRGADDEPAVVVDGHRLTGERGATRELDAYALPDRRGGRAVVDRQVTGARRTTPLPVAAGQRAAAPRAGRCRGPWSTLRR
jgi:hypothetical protein